MAQTQDKTLDVKAAYQSPTNEPFTITKSIPAPPSAHVADKTQYLERLRQAVADTQADVNRELTARMDEDKAVATAAGKGTAPLAVDEDKEEENYGEEVQDED